MNTLVTFVAIFFLLSSGYNNIAQGVSLNQEEKSLLPMEQVFSDQYSGILQRSRLVIRDAEQWRSVWSGVVKDPQSAISPPDVDFGRFMVIVAAMGMRGTGGYQIEIVKVYRESERIQVIVREISAGKGCIVSQELTSPVDIVMIAFSDEPVSFIEHQHTRDCD
jgi:hypothetical protein